MGRLQMVRGWERALHQDLQYDTQHSAKLEQPYGLVFVLVRSTQQA